MTRFFGAIFIGLSISLGLFWFMHYLVTSNQQGFAETSNLTMVEFIRLKREEIKPEVKERQKPEEPPPPEDNPPPPPMMQTSAVSPVKTPAPQMNMPNLDIPAPSMNFSGSMLEGLQVAAVKSTTPITAASSGVSTGGVSTNLIPLVRIPPKYPMRAARRRQQGWVKIEFTITATGTVTDAEVIASKPSSVFNRAALKAIAKWKFKPKVVNGKAVEQRAIQTLQFKLSR